MIPFRRAFAPFFGREATVSIVPAKRFHGGAMNREHVAVCCVPFIFSLRVVTMIEHLDFDSAKERDTGRGDGCSPDENAGIAAARQMSPVDFEDEVFVLAVCAHGAGGTAGAMDDAI